MTESIRIFKCMTIAGSDSGGGAGIQADLKTFAAFGVYGTSVITALTAQNTHSVNAIQAMDPDLITSQYRTILEDIGTDAIKIGMLFNAEIVKAVANMIKDTNPANVVIDPVMVSKSGDNLLRRDCVDVLRSDLIPIATVVTPNIPEAEELTGVTITGKASVIKAANLILGMGAKSVIMKGGHMSGDPIDYFFDGQNSIELLSKRIDTKNTHGTGCTFSSAVAANLALGRELQDSTKIAQSYVYDSIDPAFNIGTGHGPLNHFRKFWNMA